MSEFHSTLGQLSFNKCLYFDVGGVPGVPRLRVELPGTPPLGLAVAVSSRQGTDGPPQERLTLRGGPDEGKNGGDDKDRPPPVLDCLHAEGDHRQDGEDDHRDHGPREEKVKQHDRASRLDGYSRPHH